MTVRDDRGDVKQTTTGFRGPLMVQSLTSAKSKFLSLRKPVYLPVNITFGQVKRTLNVSETADELNTNLPSHGPVQVPNPG